MEAGETGMPTVRVKLLPGGATKTVEASTLLELLDKLGLSSESHVVLRDGTPLPETERLKDGDSLVVVRVLSGG